MSAILYDYALSGNCYKVRLLAALLGVKLKIEAVDFYPGGAHTSPEFLSINPAGTLPVLVDGDLTLTESQAILGYLAAKYDRSGAWFPVSDPEKLGRVQQWLAFSARLTATSGEARLHMMLRKPLEIAAAHRGAKLAFRELEAALTERSFYGDQFLCGSGPTIADIACFPYVALSADGGIEHDDYPAIRDWIFSVRTLAGFITMPGIHAVHEILTVMDESAAE